MSGFKCLNGYMKGVLVKAMDEQGVFGKGADKGNLVDSVEIYVRPSNSVNTGDSIICKIFVKPDPKIFVASLQRNSLTKGKPEYCISTYMKMRYHLANDFDISGAIFDAFSGILEGSATTHVAQVSISFIDEPYYLQGYGWCERPDILPELTDSVKPYLKVEHDMETDDRREAVPYIRGTHYEIQFPNDTVKATIVDQMLAVTARRALELHSGWQEDTIPETMDTAAFTVLSMFSGNDKSLKDIGRIAKIIDKHRNILYIA